jgi:hypothetical protein
MSTRERARLSRWWWPGQWLGIVYGAWFDQRWYWEEVRPRLNQQGGWLIYLQGVLGTLLMALLLVVGSGLVMRLFGWRLPWFLMLMGMGVGIGLALLTLKLGLTHSMGLVLTWGLWLGVALGLVFPLVPLFYGLQVTNMLIVPLLVSYAVIGTSMGLVSGVGQILQRGELVDTWQFRLTLAVCHWVMVGLVVALMGYVGGMQPGYFHLLFGLPTLNTGLAFGLWLGGRWATRQVPDVEARRMLAQGEVPRIREQARQS